MTTVKRQASESEHSDEIILPKAKADAAGVKVSAIEPGTFEQVIKTSGQVLAAQGDESVAVATVAGVDQLSWESYRGHECRDKGCYPAHHLFQQYS